MMFLYVCMCRMAPEVIVCETSFKENYTCSIDIWSFGMFLVVYQLDVMIFNDKFVCIHIHLHVYIHVSKNCALFYFT